MNTNNLKKVAPRARTAFIKAITARAGEFGITAKDVSAPTISGDVLQVAGFTHPARFAPAITRLQERVANEGFAQLIEQMAYTWFNRFCAIRFMELKSEEGYLEHGVRLLSHPTQSQGFEVLDRAPEVIESLMGEGVSLDKSALLELMLAGNEQEALFRELLLGQCHRLHQAMPFLFEAIDDETELLLPTGLTRTDAFWRELVDGIPEEDWTQVEVIGWLYQFYISEKKDEVIGKVVKSEDIPAATQLFTPNWIVQYLVQNSIGRYWLQTYPDSALPAVMPYFVFPGEQPIAVQDEYARLIPTSIEPESIKVLDPACGSGHILVEAYNLLYRIYEERGYRSRDIPQLILTHNLFGLDIDDRAAQLAGFALLMRARQDDRRLFSREIQLNVHALQESRHLNIPKLWQALNLNAEWDRGQSQDLFAVASASLASNDPRLSLLSDLHRRFLAAKTLGSLIEVPAEQVQAIDELCATLQTLSISGDAMQKPAAKALLPLLAQAAVLARRYDAVIANPPYMGSKGMNGDLKEFAKKQFPNSKSDLFAIFIERNLELANRAGLVAMITIQNWMFLSSYENLRVNILEQHGIRTLIQIGYNSFPELNSKVVQAAAFVIQAYGGPKVSEYINLNDVSQSANKQSIFLEKLSNNSIFNVHQRELTGIPGYPIAYWISPTLRSIFSTAKRLGDLAKPRQGLASGDNERFMRYWYEINQKKTDFKQTDYQCAIKSSFKWFPHNKGGAYRKWFGNNDYVLAFDEVNYNALAGMGNHLPSKQLYFKPGMSWTALTSGKFNGRYTEHSIFDAKGPVLFANQGKNIFHFMAFCNSIVATEILKILAPTLDFNQGPVGNLPIVESNKGSSLCSVSDSSKHCVEISKNDWNQYEVSWGFANNPLLSLGYHQLTLKASYQLLCAHWHNATFEMQRLEEGNNRLFIDAYGLQDELTPEVPLSEITLTCNPHYRYGGNLTDEEREARLQSDTIAELISYAIGCMMGRYSLDREGLVYAQAGNEGFKALVEEGAYATFAADEDGILPLSTDSWFEDDVATRLEAFVCTVWGKETLEENLQFIADSLCLDAIKPVKKGGETSRETLRRYLSTQFYKDHLKTYKKRPIYWLFSSGKEKAFECLVYLHRYNEATLPRMRTEYVTPLLGQMAGRIERLRLQQTEASTSDAKRIGKEIDSLTKQLAELRAFDDQLKHHADMRITLDLDDGVKVNYGKFGTLLSDVKAITGDKGE